MLTLHKSNCQTCPVAVATPEQLRVAARRSIAMQSDPTTGGRQGDPLAVLLPGGLDELRAVDRAAVAEAIGRPVEPWQGEGYRVNVAQGRAELRRWAVRTK